MQIAHKAVSGDDQPADKLQGTPVALPLTIQEEIEEKWRKIEGQWREIEGNREKVEEHRGEIEEKWREIEGQWRTS